MAGVHAATTGDQIGMPASHFIAKIVRRVISPQLSQECVHTFGAVGKIQHGTRGVWVQDWLDAIYIEVPFQAAALIEPYKIHL